MTQARLSDLAPVLNATPDGVLATLKQWGYQVQSTDETLDEVAVASGNQATDLLLAVMPTQ